MPRARATNIAGPTARGRDRSNPIFLRVQGGCKMAGGRGPTPTPVTIALLSAARLGAVCPLVGVGHDTRPEHPDQLWLLQLLQPSDPETGLGM